MKIYLRFFPLLIASALVLATACSDDQGLEKYQQESETKWLGNDVDPNQTWMTGMPVYLNITAPAGSTITAQSIMNEKVIILGQKVTNGHEIMTIDMPQGIGNSFGVVCDEGKPQKRYTRIDLTGEQPQVTDVDFSNASYAVTTRTIAAQAATNQSLYGNSILADCGYFNFGSWAWNDLASALQESQNASSNYQALIDYEMLARGELVPGGEYQAQETIYLSFLYGFTGQYSSRTLGYYTHCGDYSDIVFHDIAETLTKDYLNGKAKVQYQLDGNTAKWHDANFDYRDADGLPSGTSTTSQTARQGDDCYNSLKVKEAYGDRVTSVRGLTFKLDIAKGQVYGFYLRSNDAITSDQVTILKDLGIPEDKLPTKAANYSNANMNTTGKGKFRSAMAIYDNFTFMGLDDDIGSGGDLDCNDVTFALSNVNGEKLIPKFTESTLNSKLNEKTLEKHPEYGDSSSSESGEGGESGESGSSTMLQSWTLGFEDSGRSTDFDFNDVVLQITPNTSTHTVSVVLMAAGGMKKAEVCYNDPTSGLVNLGEVHDLFGVSTTTMINTGAKMTKSGVLLSESLNWPDGYTMSANRHSFSIKVYNTDGTAVERTVYGDSVLEEDNTIPEAICVSGEWSWPQELTRLDDAYPIIGLWGRQFNDPEHWNWYSQPNSAKITKRP